MAKTSKKKTIKSEEVTKEVETKVEVSSSKDDIFLELLKQINDLKAQVESKPAVVSKGSEETEEDILEDYLETPVFFYVYKSYYRISTDFRKNRVTQLPIGEKIEFKTVLRKKVKKGRAEGVISVSRAKIQSKKNVDWLRDHTLYNVLFFEDINSAKDADASLAQEMVRISNTVRSMPEAIVLSSCKSRGIQLNPDIDVLRISLIHHMANANKQVNNNKARKFAEATHPDNRLDSAQKIGLDGGTSSRSNIY